MPVHECRETFLQLSSSHLALMRTSQVALLHEVSPQQKRKPIAQLSFGHRGSVLRRAPPRSILRSALISLFLWSTHITSILRSTHVSSIWSVFRPIRKGF